MTPTARSSFALGFAALALSALCGGVVIDHLVEMSLSDFLLPGTQVGDLDASHFPASDECATCHGDYDSQNEPYFLWKGSLMGIAGRDPLYEAQVTLAEQDVANVGQFCMRCHVPLTFVSGHASDPDGGLIDHYDRDGVSCIICHTMVDPIYDPATSPPEDETVLANLATPPTHYGNAMFVLDPSGLRRGPYDDAIPPHEAIESSFMRSGNMCGTCHDVGNVAVSRQPDGTYRYNSIGEPTPDTDPHALFPLERTFTEWNLSAFANGGVDMGGRFGGTGGSVVSSCQDCHMPRTQARGCYYGPERDDLARHEFAGASAWVLKIAALHYQDDPAIDQAALAAGQQRAISMVGRAATLDLGLEGDNLTVRVINESGHKLPTGHIEGRRAWVNVKFFDAEEALLLEHGHYDVASAELDVDTTMVFEMHVGLSEEASLATGLPSGETTHMALADTIVKDTRIPPRGFDPVAYAEAGAPAVGYDYASGEHWADIEFPVPAGTERADVTVYYQTVTNHYIEALRRGNHTDHWGETLHDLWTQTDKCPPIEITARSLNLIEVDALLMR